MSKERRTFSLDPEVDEYLDRDGVNASELANKVIKHHMSAGGDKKDMLELRKEQLKSDISELENSLETKKEELETVIERLDQIEDKKEDIYQEAGEVLTYTDLREKNQRVEYWANEVGVPVEEFVDELEKRGST